MGQEGEGEKSLSIPVERGPKPGQQELTSHVLFHLTAFSKRSLQIQGQDCKLFALPFPWCKTRGGFPTTKDLF